MVTCGCGNTGLYSMVWHIAVGQGPSTRPGDFIIMHKRFIVPCSLCNLAAYSRWFAAHQAELDEYSPYVVGQESTVAHA